MRIKKVSLVRIISYSDSTDWGEFEDATNRVIYDLEQAGWRVKSVQLEAAGFVLLHFEQPNL